MQQSYEVVALDGEEPSVSDSTRLTVLPSLPLSACEKLCRPLSRAVLGCDRDEVSLTRKLLGAVVLRWSLMILGGKMRERCGMRALERVDGPSGFSLLGGCQHWRPSPSLCETVSIRL